MEYWSDGVVVVNGRRNGVLEEWRNGMLEFRVWRFCII